MSQLKEFLKKSDAILKINGMFELKKWTLVPEDDVLGRSGEYIALRIISDVCPATMSVRIEKKEPAELIAEVEEKMRFLMARYTEDICSRWKGGLI